MSGKSTPKPCANIAGEEKKDDDEKKVTFAQTKADRRMEEEMAKEDKEEEEKFKKEMAMIQKHFGIKPANKAKDHQIQCDAAGVFVPIPSASKECGGIGFITHQILANKSSIAHFVAISQLCEWCFNMIAMKPGTLLLDIDNDTEASEASVGNART